MNLIDKLKAVGRKDLVLKIAAVNIKDLIKDFIREDEFYKNLKSANDFCGKCDGVANDFYNFLKSRNIKSSIISGVGYLKSPLTNSAKKILKTDPKYLTHVVVRIGNKVVDLTGKQFGNTPIRIMPFSMFKKEWKTIKNGPYWKIRSLSVEGIASKGYAILGDGDNKIYINTPGSRAEITFLIVKSVNKYFVLSTKRKGKGRFFDYTYLHNSYISNMKNALKTIKRLAITAGDHEILKYFKENLSPKEFTKLILIKENFSVKTFNEWFPELKQTAKDDEEDLFNFNINYDTSIKDKDKDKIAEFIERGSKELASFGLTNILYGKIFVVDKLPGNVIALYDRASDLVKISRRAARKYNPDMGRNFIHELGHRLWTKNKVDKFLVGKLYGQVKYGFMQDELEIGDVFLNKQGKTVELVEKKEGTYPYYKVKKEGYKKLQDEGVGAFKYMTKIKGKPMTDPEIWKPSPYSMKNGEEYFCEILAYALINDNKLYKDFLKKTII